jgi:hypothetical protein
MCAYSSAETILVSRTVLDSPANGFSNEDRIYISMSGFPNFAMGMQGLSKFEAGYTRRLPPDMWRVGKQEARSRPCM